MYQVSNLIELLTLSSVHLNLRSVIYEKIQENLIRIKKNNSKWKFD